MCAVKLIIIRETGMPASTTMGRMPNTLIMTLCDALSYSSLVYQITLYKEAESKSKLPSHLNPIAGLLTYSMEQSPSREANWFCS